MVPPLYTHRIQAKLDCQFQLHPHTFRRREAKPIPPRFIIMQPIGGVSLYLLLKPAYALAVCTGCSGVMEEVIRKIGIRFDGARCPNGRFTRVANRDEKQPTTL